MNINYTIVKIKSIKLSRLNNNEYGNFLKSVENLVTDASLEKLSIQEEVFDKFKQAVNQLIDITNKSRLRVETKELNKMNKLRDELASYLLANIKIESKSPLLSRKKSATSLYAETANYIGLQYEPNRQKTHIINALISDLEKKQNAIDLDILGLSEVVRDLKQVNNSYAEILQIRAEEQVKDATDNSKKIRKELDMYYDLITNWAYASSLILSSQETKVFVVLLNKLIDDTINAYKLRTASKKVEKSESTSV